MIRRIPRGEQLEQCAIRYRRLIWQEGELLRTYKYLVSSALRASFPEVYLPRIGLNRRILDLDRRILDRGPESVWKEGESIALVCIPEPECDDGRATVCRRLAIAESLERFAQLLRLSLREQEQSLLSIGYAHQMYSATSLFSRLSWSEVLLKKLDLVLRIEVEKYLRKESTRRGEELAITNLVEDLLTVRMFPSTLVTQNIVRGLAGFIFESGKNLERIGVQWSDSTFAWSTFGVLSLYCSLAALSGIWSNVERATDEEWQIVIGYLRERAPSFPMVKERCTEFLFLITGKAAGARGVQRQHSVGGIDVLLNGVLSNLGLVLREICSGDRESLTDSVCDLVKSIRRIEKVSARTGWEDTYAQIEISEILGPNASL